ncbi:MAG: hypothetical protein L0220_17445, partial [Acidobacteria bacterium]|nr:hypothetical protein [Acidobacteriota bacterium]
MRKFFNIALVLWLIYTTAVGGTNAKSAEQRRVASTETTASRAVSLSAKATTTDELIGLLPASDLIALIDARRAFNDLLPRMAGVSIMGLDRLAKEIQEFITKTGIDPTKAQNAVVGLSLAGTQAKGAFIIQGLDLDDQKLEAAMRAYKTEFKTSEYKGKQIYSITGKVRSPSAGPLSLKTDESAVATLGQQKIVLGDLSAVKNVIDIHLGAAKGGVTAAMIGALNETKNSALVRFALNIPENLRQEAMTQGDLFKSVAAIKMILGTFDVANDLSLSLDTIMRTPSQNEASELESGLRGLL